MKDSMLPIDVAGTKLSIGAGHVLWVGDMDTPLIQSAKVAGDTAASHHHGVVVSVEPVGPCMARRWGAALCWGCRLARGAFGRE